MSELLERLVASVHGIAGVHRETLRVGPFTAYVDHDRSVKFLNFALPDTATGEDARPALEALRAAFSQRRRNARIEMIEDLCPELPAVLESEGWALSERIPVLTCTPQTLAAPPTPDGVEIVDVTVEAPDETLRELLETQRDAFGDEEDLVDEHLAVFRRRRVDDVVVAGVVDGRIVATAQCTPASGGVVEAVAVCTLAAYRRRGIAGALTAAAVERAFDRGAELAWLSAADDGAERIYARAGFSVAGRQADYDAA